MLSIPTTWRRNEITIDVAEMVMSLHPMYTVSGKKRGYVIFNYNSRIFWSILIIFVPLETGVNT